MKYIKDRNLNGLINLIFYFSFWVKIRIYSFLKILILNFNGNEISYSVIIFPGSQIYNYIGGGKIYISKNTIIHHGSKILTYGGNIHIGKNCSLNSYSIIQSSTGNLIIESDVRIGSLTHIVSANHIYGKDILVRKKTKSDGIKISENTWIGSSVVITDGTHIFKNSVIAANSIVRGKLTKSGVYAGSPAKLIKEL
jgi:acetyltransferase-like isoleucine patch superfamily enzyme